MCKELEPSLDDLMRATHQIDFMLLAKFPDHLFTENVRNAAFILTPVFHAVIGICPEQIAEQANIWRVLRLLNVVDLRKVDEVGR